MLVFSIRPVLFHPLCGFCGEDPVHSHPYARIPGHEIFVALVHRTAELHPVILFHGIVPPKVIVFVQNRRRIFFRIADHIIHRFTPPTGYYVQKNSKIIPFSNSKSLRIKKSPPFRRDEAIQTRRKIQRVWDTCSENQQDF
jgi:hypothetical protein